MNLIITDETALQLYNLYRNGNILISNIKRVNIQPDIFNKSKIEYDLIKDFAKRIGIEKPSLLVKNCITKSKVKDVKLYYTDFNYPENSFIHFHHKYDNYYIISPELLFCRMANKLDYSQIFKLGMKICGNYTMNPENDCIFGIDQLCTSAKIKSYINKLSKSANKYPGINKAKTVASLLEDGSASPYETLLYIKLVTSACKGGYGVKELKMNQEIKLSDEAKVIAGQNSLYVDMSNNKNKIAIEYDSEQFHDNSLQNIKDKRRIDALVHDGWKVYSIVLPQLISNEAFDYIARSILKSNKQSNRIRVKNYNSKQLNLNYSLNI